MGLGVTSEIVCLAWVPSNSPATVIGPDATMMSSPSGLVMTWVVKVHVLVCPLLQFTISVTVFDGTNAVQESVVVPPKVMDAEVIPVGGTEIHDVKVSVPPYWTGAGVLVRPGL